MNCFYVLYCIRSLLVDSPTHSVVSITSEATVQRETEGVAVNRICVRGSRPEVVLHSAAASDAHYGLCGRGVMCLAMTLWILFAVQTYSAGYHTPRHMIYGAGAGMMTLLVFDDLSGWTSFWLIWVSGGDCQEVRSGDATPSGS